MLFWNWCSNYLLYFLCVVGFDAQFDDDIFACLCLIFQKTKINELGILQSGIINFTQLYTIHWFLIVFLKVKHTHAKKPSSNCASTPEFINYATRTNSVHSQIFSFAHISIWKLSFVNLRTSKNKTKTHYKKQINKKYTLTLVNSIFGTRSCFTKFLFLTINRQLLCMYVDKWKNTAT